VNVPDFIIELVVGKDVRPDFYYMCAAGQNLVFMEVAATHLEADADLDHPEAAYHIYAGISAARSALDAASHWMRTTLSLPVSSLLACDLTKREFRKLLRDAGQAQLAHEFSRHGDLFKRIDDYREMLQHREGLASMPVVYPSQRRVWAVPKDPSQGMNGIPLGFWEVPELLRSWRLEIEGILRQIVSAVESSKEQI
jgi:hypothetical protein